MAVVLETALSSFITNKRRVSALKSLGITTVQDLLTHYPFRVAKPYPVHALSLAKVGEEMASVVQVRHVRVMKGSGRSPSRVEAIVEDESEDSQDLLFDNAGTARIVFFSRNRGYTDWMAKRLQVGTQLVIAGTPSVFNNQLQFTHPDIIVTHYANGSAAEVDSAEHALARLARPRPVYHANSRISSEHIHDVIMSTLQLLAQESPDYVVAATADAMGSVAPQQLEYHINPDDLEYALPDIIPEQIRQEQGLMHRSQAYIAMHSPDSAQQFNQALHTLRVEEAMIAQTALVSAREQSKQDSAWQCGVGDATSSAYGAGNANSAAQNSAAQNSDAQSSDVQGSLVQQFIQTLPFTLTQGQQEVVDTIMRDMAQQHPMQRLLQGEVGSGKTVVALIAMLQAVGSGYQAVLVAPTQVLAEQHAHSIRAMLSKLRESEGAAPTIPEIPVTLLTGGLKLAQRRRALAQAASGEAGIIVATHAAFSQHFQAPNLALVVIDEQHRFGVQQREILRNLNDHAPHMLVMTATPIPRTAAMTWFGDLDISWLTELPGGRKPITTVIVPEADGATMGRMFAHIRARIDAGERAYIVCPRIEVSPSDLQSDEALDSGDLEADELADDPWAELIKAQDGSTPRPPMHAVFEIAERLQALPQFAGIKFATLTGRDDDETKAQVMHDFATGITPVLVATTVIEVGIDVPQASCIVVFDADRFGLSQLHQLRGRVGRGGTKSWAFMISRAPADSVAEERLQVIRDSSDGFEIAKADLEFRGAGDVLGDVQSGGQSSLKLLRVVKDAKIISDARQYAERLIADDPQLHEYKQLAGAVLDFMRGNEQYLTSN